MNGFEKHGIEHLSAASINLWTNAPDIWVMAYLFKTRTSMGPAPWRGIVIEDAVVETLLGGNEEEAIAKALKKFDQRFIIGNEYSSKQRAMIEPMVQQSIEALAEMGKPEFPDESHQEKISITAKGDGWEIPIIGYLDLVYPQHGEVIDLKTTARVPSKMSPEHQLQRAIYAKAKGNMSVKFLYVSAKKSALLEDGDVNEALAKAKLQISRLERFLNANDRDSALATVPHNPNSFYWGGADDLREKFYGQ